jgi:large subunit ribosomal protein L4
MPKVKVYNLSREDAGEIELADEVFAAEVNEALLYDIVKAQLASRRAGTAKTKGRAEVRGSSRKLYKQKGTGRARHGSIRAQQYVGGGKAHGPQPHSFAYRPTRKQRLGALKSALSLKLRDGQLTVVSDLKLAEIKTKGLTQVLDALNVGAGCLLVDVNGNDNLRLSARNLSNHQFLPPEGVNVYDLLRFEHLVLTKDAAAAIQKRFTGESA